MHVSELILQCEISMEFQFVRYVEYLSWMKSHVHSLRMLNVIVELVPYKLCAKLRKELSKPIYRVVIFDICLLH